VPHDKCQGSPLASGPQKGKVKVHREVKQVQRCQKNYLLSQGYEMRGPREFYDPKRGDVLVLDKRPGIPVRTGKAGEKGKGYGKGRTMTDPHTVAMW